MSIYVDNLISLDRRITPTQFYLLADVIQSMRFLPIPEAGYIKRVLAPGAKEKIYLVNAAHYFPYDTLGEYHFDIRLGNGPIRHVYLQLAFDQSPLAIAPDSTANVEPTVNYSWQFVQMT
uniref:Uncharacterized protein n=1 Tax=viral metagenome TaxID=1070528 RepID=A0A6C0BIV0_9ZZZZ